MPCGSSLPPPTTCSANPYSRMARTCSRLTPARADQLKPAHRALTLACPVPVPHCPPTLSSSSSWAVAAAQQAVFAAAIWILPQAVQQLLSASLTAAFRPPHGTAVAVQRSHRTAQVWTQGGCSKNRLAVVRGMGCHHLGFLESQSSCGAAPASLYAQGWWDVPWVGWGLGQAGLRDLAVGQTKTLWPVA